ncbi:MAG: ABC transporter ATP-binding protein [Burkholderiales bacterium]
MASPVLSVRSLSKRFELYDRPADRLLQTLWRGRRQFYRDFWALRDVGFALGPGQALGVVGRNGSGKSTLLQLVAGTLAPTTGEVEANGRISALLELGSGFNPEFTGRENVYLNGAILGVPHAEMRALMPELLAFADIGDFVDRQVKTYSSGMALRLAFAVATAVAPRILIVDEALAVGDEAFQRKCFARIEKIRESGAAILFVSHSPLQVLELCDVALLLDGGEMLLRDEPRRVVAEYQRLLYAAPDAAAHLRGTLMAARDAAKSAAAAPSPAAGAAAAPEPATTAAGTRTAAFDPDLRSSSTIEYAPNGARIHAPRITTTAGVAVNVLVGGDVYCYEYEVEFLRAARAVGYGMMVKTTSGLELGGTTHFEPGYRAAEMRAGQRVRVRFEFRCRLFAGLYFLNAGVVTEEDGAAAYLHRLVDAVAFRVQHDPARRPSTYVDFEVRAGVTPVAGTADA